MGRTFQQLVEFSEMLVDRPTLVFVQGRLAEPDLIESLNDMPAGLDKLRSTRGERVADRLEKFPGRLRFGTAMAALCQQRLESLVKLDRPPSRTARMPGEALEPFSQSLCRRRVPETPGGDAPIGKPPEHRNDKIGRAHV